MKLQLDDGTELFYTVDDFTDPWTEPETIVLHHGMAKSHKMWFGWVPILGEHHHSPTGPPDRRPGLHPLVCRPDGGDTRVSG
jgi:hypothetical protein